MISICIYSIQWVVVLFRISSHVCANPIMWKLGGCQLSVISVLLRVIKETSVKEISNKKVNAEFNKINLLQKWKQHSDYAYGNVKNFHFGGNGKAGVVGEFSLPLCGTEL